MPKITFILPIYKVERYLPQAIFSLKNQTMGDWEAILIDDGSPDGCGEICDLAVAEDSRFRVIHQKNSGVGSARNAGLDIAAGEYIHFFDPDDYIDLDMAEKLTKQADLHGADVVFFGRCEEVMDNDRVISSSTEKPPIVGVFRGEPFKTLFDKLADQHMLTDKLFRRSLIERQKTRFTDKKVGEDGVFMANLYYSSPSCIVGVEDAYYHYRTKRSGSASNSFYPDRVNDNFYLSDAIYDVVKSWGLEKVPMYRETLQYCLLLDLQLSIKNMSLSPANFREKVVWLRKIASEQKVREAIRDIPINKFNSRNDRIKITCLKLKLYGLVTLLSSLNRKIR